MAKDYYNILGVDKNATEDEIKSAYRKKAIEFHPDKQVGKSDAEKKEAEEKFKEVAEAYQILSDAEKRQRYDRFGTVDDNFGSGFNPSDIFSSFMRSMHFGFGGSMGDDFFGGRKRQVKGTDKMVNVTLTIEEVYKLAQKTIRYDAYVKCEDCNGSGSTDGKTITCPHCNGTGYVTTKVRRGIMYVENSYECPKCHGTGISVSQPCSKCNGFGVIRKEVEYTFNILPGTTNNVKFFGGSGLGNACRNGIGASGDLYIHVESVLPMNGFSVNNDAPYDIDYVMNVSVLDCITGCEKSFRHIDGKEYRLTIKPGATNGYTIKLRNLGLCYPQSNNRGFLNIRINQIMPAKLSKDEKSTLEKLKKSKNFK